MSRATTLVTDGSPDSEALAHWLEHRAGAMRIVRALSRADVPPVVARVRGAEPSTRLVVLAEEEVDTDVRTHDALASVRSWLAALGPYERRIQGVEAIDAAITRRERGASDVERLARAVSAGAVRRTPATGRRKVGRPPGSDPFRGAGFDVCVTLLLHPGTSFTERALATACGRSPFAVHRVLAQLDEKGLVERMRGATTAKSAIALRDELAAAWRRRVGTPRKAWSFESPVRRGGLEKAIATLESAGRRPLLAGPSAPDAHLVGGLPILYVDEDPSALLRADGFMPTTAIGNLVVWEAVEKAIHLEPRSGAPCASTNHVVTYLDLVITGIDRDADAARQLWENEAKT